MEDLRKEIISRIRSCLVSTKGMVTVRQLESDYRTLLGERIPYQKLGHKTLESFLQSIPTIYATVSSQGELLVDAKVTEQSAHISSMVGRQKTSGTKKKTKRPPPPIYRTSHSRLPPLPSPTWRPIGGSKKSGVKSTSVENHFQFVNIPKVASKVVVPPTSHLYKRQSPPKLSPPKKTVPKVSPPLTIQPPHVENVRKTTMERICNRMQEITIERDSGNSSPTSEFTRPKEFAKTGDPILDLRRFVESHKLGDIQVKFTETKTKKKKKRPQIHCKITVGQHTYSSYPEDFFEVAPAEVHASQKALDDLIPKYTNRGSLLISSNEDIIARIPPMLEKHKGAVWMWQIEADYMTRYNEQLPTDWLQVIDSSPFISIEKCLGAYVLKHVDPNDVRHKENEGQKSLLNLGDVSVPCNTVNFNEENRLYAVIVSATSACEVWCQQCSTPDHDKFNEMSELMDAFYNTGALLQRPASIRPGGFYVVLHESAWYRARALHTQDFDSVRLFLIDYGEEIKASDSDIYVLRREFAVEQAQAFVCKLEGLDDLCEASEDSDYLNELIGKEVSLELVTETEREEDDVVLPVVLYDVNDGHSINEELIKSLMIESALPGLDKKTISSVYVCNIEPNGDLYVQVHSYGYRRLLELLENVASRITKTPPPHPCPPTRETPSDCIYLVKDKLSSKWLRATIIDWAPFGTLAQIYFIDYGNTQVVNVNNEVMIPIEEIDTFLGKIPAQAVRVRMTIEKIPSDFVEKTRLLLPADQTILLKIDHFNNEKIPFVELFIRTKEGMLVFVNKSLCVEAEMKDVRANNVNSNENAKKRLLHLVQYGESSKIANGLKKPLLPKIGEYFNVNISFSVNPWNFFIQPLDTQKELTVLMKEMQEFYKDIQFSPMPIEEIIPGRIYAAKHEDGLWYRTNILKVINSGSISVFYSDFGFYTNLTVAQLVPLSPKYMSLPCQALKAKMAEIKPLKNRWSVEDCNFFNNLVTKKHFVSIIVSIDKDELHKNDNVIQLLLVDTTQQKDVSIKNLLVQKGIAAHI